MKTDVLVDILSKDYLLANGDIMYDLMRRIHHSYDSYNDNPYHLEDTLYIHTKMVEEEAKKVDKYDEDLILCATLHDIGKLLARREIVERERVSFQGHEGVSFYLSQAVMRALNKYKNANLSTTKIKDIATIVSLHDITYKYKNEFLNLNSMQEFVDKFYFTKKKDIYRTLLKLIYADIKGRITTKDIEKENVKILNKIDKFLLEDYELNYNELDKNKPFAELLVGVQNVGKSTYINKYHNEGDRNIISRDKILMDVCKDFGADTFSYNECFKFVSENGLQKEVDRRLQQQLSEYKKQDKHLIIDMMNITKKRRRFFVNQLKKKFNVVATIFYSSFDDIVNRNKYREGKVIDNKILIDSMKRFEYPLLNMENIVDKGDYSTLY